MNRSLVGFGLAACFLAGASAQSYVGSFQVDQGPFWWDNPACYSGVDAAALLFGGSPSDYRISTNPSMDPNTITDTAWYTVIGIGGGTEYADDYFQDVGNNGYGGGGWNAGDDASAYCWDNAQGADFTNYVWRVPTPGAAAVFGVAGLMAGRRRRA